MKDRPKTPESPMSRRRFVAMVAAGSAALLARPAGSVTAPPARKGVRPRAAEAMSARDQAEYVRQKGVTIDTLKVIRGHQMPPGTELASIFRPVKSSRRGS